MKGPVVSIKCNFTLAQFLFIQFVCVKVFENHADGKDLVGSDTKKQFHFISGNRGPGIEMVIALLLSAMIVPTLLYCTTGPSESAAFFQVETVLRSDSETQSVIDLTFTRLCHK